MYFQQIIQRRSWLAVVTMLFCAIFSGCGASAPVAIDSRLLGKWEARRGFSGELKVEFLQSGVAKVIDTGAKPAKEYQVKWYLFEGGKESIKIHMQPGGKDAFELRTIKFLDANSMEMKVGAKILGRFQRI
jgi:hypothetical protein